jgi:hypothetical protein
LNNKERELAARMSIFVKKKIFKEENGRKRVAG